MKTVLIIAATFYSILNAQEFDPVISENLQHSLDSTLNANNIIGASAAVIMPEKGIWTGVSGYSDPANNDKIKPDMIFDMGSITKSFNAALILRLAEEGYLTLDDSLHQYLPFFNRIDSTATIRQLLNHTSGIGEYLDNVIDLVFADPDSFWTPERILSYINSRSFFPGQSWKHSNTNNILAGMIIKEVTNSPTFAIPLRTYLLDPLDLDTIFILSEENVTGELAHGWYNYDGQPGLDDISNLSRTAYYSMAWTAGGMVSTALDLAKWSNALFDGKILNQGSLEQMVTIAPGSEYTYADWVPGWGLGFHTIILKGKELWGHTGWTHSMCAIMIYYPEERVSIVVMVNQTPMGMGNFVWSDMIAESLFGEVLDFYQYPYDKVHPYNIKLSSTYVKPNLDTLYLTSMVNNPESHTVNVFARIVSTDDAVKDSVELFDDGNHHDGEVGDLVFGGELGPINEENEFKLGFGIKDNDTGVYTIFNDNKRITTIGPIIVENISFRSIFGTVYALDLSLRNLGHTTTARNITVELTTTDTINVLSIVPINTDGIDILANQVAEIEQSHNISFASPPSSEIPFTVKIYGNGHFFWKDDTTWTSIEIEDLTIPLTYSLSQNYPNPFNPSTMINYQLPMSSDVNLSIYNLLGQKVAILVNEKQHAGTYKVEWDASGFASGIYYYRIEIGDLAGQTGEFSEVRKMVLIK